MAVLETEAGFDTKSTLLDERTSKSRSSPEKIICQEVRLAHSS